MVSEAIKVIKVIKKAISKRLVSVFMLLLFICAGCTRAWAAIEIAGAKSPDFTYDIRSMIQMNPDFSTYAGENGKAPDGVIWLKRIDYGMAPDGGVERQTMWILLGREGISPDWLSWNIPVPKGGEAELLEASVFRVTGDDAELLEASVSSVTGGGLESQGPGVVFDDLPDNFILVVHYREVFPEKLSVDDLVWTSESLPVWETVISVTVPAGHPFYHFSSQNIVPQEQEIDNRMVYEWRVLNTAAEVSPSILAAGREYVVFGSRDDKGIAARLIKAAEDAPLPPPPSAVRDMFGKRNKAEIAEDVLNWLYTQPGVSLTSGTREVPPEAPWTNREKILLAGDWLKEAGVDTLLFWRLAFAPGDGKPVSEAVIVGPVLEVSPPDSKAGSFYCDMEHPPRADGNVLGGEMIYGLARDTAGGGLETRRTPVPGAAENRLSYRFDLSLSEDGLMTGTIRIAARKAWRHFLFSDKPDDGDLARLLSGVFAQVPRYSDVTFKESKTESEIVITLAGTQGIKGTEGNHIMTSLPSLIPEWFKSLSSGPVPYDLRFPFTMDARVTLTLPASTANVLLPSPASQIAGKVRYSESYKFDRRKKFLAEVHMSVETTSISDDEAAYLNTALQHWQSFMTRHLPVQLKAR